jgi:hypothetical protein
MIGESAFNRALYSIGLERRRRASDLVLPVLGMFGTGMLIGAGIGLLFAPRRGAELREHVGRRVNEMIPTRLRRSISRSERHGASATR